MTNKVRWGNYICPYYRVFVPYYGFASSTEHNDYLFEITQFLKYNKMPCTVMSSHAGRCIQLENIEDKNLMMLSFEHIKDFS